MTRGAVTGPRAASQSPEVGDDLRAQRGQAEAPAQLQAGFLFHPDGRVAVVKEMARAVVPPVDGPAAGTGRERRSFQ